MSNERHLYSAFSGVVQQRGQNQNWLHNSCLLGVPMLGKGRYGYVTPCSLGVPMVRTNMATSPMPTWVPIVGKDQSGYITPALGIPNRGTKSEVSAQILPSSWALLGARENAPPQKKPSILSTNTWGDLFYHPLQMGHQNFSILACTMAGTF